MRAAWRDAARRPRVYPKHARSAGVEVNRLADEDVSKRGRPSLLSGLAEVATRIWQNQPVRDESEFAAQFRVHAFADARVATWASAVVGCALMIQRSLDHPSIGMGDILSGLVLFWAPPLTFALFADWSRRNYQWLLIIAFALRFVRVGGGIYQEMRSVEETAMAVMSLTMAEDPETPPAASRGVRMRSRGVRRSSTTL